MTITDILDHLGIKHWSAGEHHHVSQGWEGVDCPNCSPNSGRARLGINLRTGAANCWVCGPVGRLNAISLLGDIGKGEARGLLDQFIPARIADRPRGQLRLPSGLEELQKPHRDYLERRGFDPDVLVKLWKLQGTGKHSTVPWHIFIPITYDGEMVSWTMRALHDQGKRYHNATSEQEIMSCKSVLYGLEYARQGVCVVEGAFDVFRVGPGSVCTLGVAYTAPQALQLASFARRIICFDSDRAGRAKACTLADLLSVYDGETFVVHLNSKDPGSAGRKEIAELRRMLDE